MSTIDDTDPQIPTATEEEEEEVPVSTDYDKLQDTRLDKLETAIKKLQEGPPPPPPVVPQKPPGGFIKPGGWGANPDPHTHSSAKMKDKKYREKWKVVDDKGINVITEYPKEEYAKQYIEWELYNYTNPPPPPPPPPDHECPAGQEWSEVEQKCIPKPPPPPPPTGDKDQFGILKIAPDKAGGKTFTNFEAEYKMRNYASGKPSEWSVENTADLGAKLSDIETTYYVKIRGFKTHEPDTISTKVLGPSHSDGAGRSWYISQLMTDGTDKMTFQTEEPHPENHDNHQPVKFKVGESVVGKWVGIKTVTYLINSGKDRRIEMWLDYPVQDINNPPNQWRMYWGVDDTGQLDHGHFIVPTGSLVTCRIDGCTKGDEPEFKYASVREVTAPTGGPPPPPPPPDHECPAGQEWNESQQKCVDKIVIPPPGPGTAGQDKFGVKLMHSDGSNIDYAFTENFRPDGKRFDFESPKAIPMVNCELTGYFADFDGIDDEVSGKQRGGNHSSGSVPKTYDMGVKTTNGACRYRTEEKHPDYEDATAINTLASGLGVGLKDKFIGYKFVCRNVLDNKAVNLQIWQDTGNNEGSTPANQWKQIANYVVKDPLWLTVANDHQETIRIDDDGGAPKLKWKWLSLAEIKS